MEYASITFWLLVVIFCALGVHRLWSSMIQPRIVNSILLPGTLVAQLGHVLGLLVTGGTVNNTSLIKDDDSGGPQTPPETQTRIPVLGAIMIALLPLAGCAAAIYWVSSYFGGPILAGMAAAAPAGLELPLSLGAFFDTLRAAVTLVQQLVLSVQAGDYHDWRTWLFLYLAVCLTVRMAPLTGNLRGSIGAILMTGLLAFLVGQVMRSPSALMSGAWPLIVFSVAVLLFLLMVSLLAKGAVLLVKTLQGQG
ncbi:MAG: hypothetical protein HRF43_11365 [Phycisphaerae bacterium]|jgi:hypothetical protein